MKMMQSMRFPFKNLHASAIFAKKTFKNGKALGGHRRSHFLKKIKLETPSSPEISPNTYEASEKRMQVSSFSLSSDEDDDKHEVSILGPTHNCNICGKNLGAETHWVVTRDLTFLRRN